MRSRPTAWIGIIVVALASFASLVPGALADPDPKEERREKRLLETYRKMLQEDPSAEYPYRRLLEVSHAEGGVVGLIELYKKEVAAKPRGYANWMVLGHLYRTSEKKAQATSAYLEAASLAKRKPAPHVALAKLHRQEREWKFALDAFDRAIALTKDRIAKQEALKAAAGTAMEAKDVARAEAYFKALVKTEPRNLFLRMEYASTLTRSGHHERALELWLALKKRAGGELKHLVIILREIAELQTTLKRFDEAEATWREGLRKTSEGHWARATFLDGLIGIHRRQDRLMQLIDSWLPKSRKSYQILVTVARLYEELADDKKALDLYQQAVKRRPSNAAARMRVIKLLERSGRTDEVIKAYRALIKSTRGEPRYEIRLAEMYFHRGRSKEGFKMLKGLSRRYKSDPGIHQSIIDLLMRYGNRRSRGKIEAEYKILTRLEPREESHYISLGELYWSSGDRKMALATWSKLLKVARSRAEGYFLLAEVYVNHNMTKEAAQAFEQALKREPNNPRFLQAYALMLEKLRKIQEALRQWKRVLKSPGRKNMAISREARRRVIALWEREGRLDLEISRMEEELRQEPPDATIGTFLGSIYLRLRRLEDAERVFRRVLELNDGQVQALVGLETIYTRQSRPEKALKILDRLAKVDSRSASEYMHRAADLALSLGQQDQALGFMRRVVELHPADPNAHMRVAELHQRMGSLAQAAEAWRQALLLDPRNHRVQFRLASVYREIGNAIREEQVLSDIIRMAHEPSDILKAGRHLLRVAVLTGRLEAAEEVIRPLVFNRRNRDVYLKLLIDVFSALSREVTYGQDDADVRDKRLRAIGSRGLKPLLDALASSDVALRAKAMEVIGLTRPAAAGNALGRLAQSHDRDLQFRSALALGKIGTESAVRELQKLVRVPNRDIRTMAVWALGQSPSKAAGKILSQLTKGGASTTRLYAALALGQHSGEASRQSVESLLEILDRASPRPVRLAAIHSLGRIGSEASVPHLLEALWRIGARRKFIKLGDQGYFRLEAQLLSWALGRTGKKEGHRELLARVWSPDFPYGQQIGQCLWHQRTAAEDRMLSWAYDNLVDAARGRIVRKQSARVLKLPRCTMSNDVSVKERLASIAHLLPDLFARHLLSGEEEAQALLTSLLPTGASFSLEPLFPGLHANPTVHEFVASTLRGQGSALRFLAQGSGGEESQRLALEALARLAPRWPEGLVDADMRALALEGLRLPRPRTKRAAARLLDRIPGLQNPAEVLTLVRAELASPRAATDLLLRLELARLLASHHVPKDAPLLVHYLQDDAASVREATLDGLSRGDHRAVVAHIGRRLTDPITTVRRRAARVLVSSPYREARKEAEKRLPDLEPMTARYLRLLLKESAP